MEPTVDAAGQPVTTQRIAVGPAASQIAIKQLGTNGGGFFNVNSAHPLENPTPLSNFLELLAILLDPRRSVLHVRRNGRGSQARLGHPGCHGAVVCAAARARHLRRTSGQSGACSSRRRSGGQRCAARREHGGQGSSIWHRQFGSLERGDDRGFQRISQRDARFVHASGRTRRDVAHAVGRSRLWRRWFRPLRNARVRHRRGVHRRTDGRTDARISRQEDRGVRDEDGCPGGSASLRDGIGGNRGECRQRPQGDPRSSTRDRMA